MSDKICVIASHDRRRAGLKFKAGQRTVIDRPEDDAEAEQLLNAIVSDPVLRVVPLADDEKAAAKQRDSSQEPASASKPKGRGTSRTKGNDTPKGDKAGTKPAPDAKPES